MTYQIFQLPKQTLIGSAAIKPSWKVSFFLTGTTTPTPVYTTSALSVAHTQPVQADSGGVLAAVYLDPAIVYKASVYDQNDVLQYTVDPVNDSLLSAAAIGALLYPRTAAEISAGVTPTNYAYPPDDIRRLGAVGDGTTSDTTAISNAALIGGDWRVPAGFQVRITATITIVKAVRFYSLGPVSPNPPSAPTQAYLLHDFSGTFFDLVGSASSDKIGAGVIFDGISLVQVNGNGSGASGVCIRNVATSDNQKCPWLRMNNFQIETASGANQWTGGILLDGMANTSGGTQNRDIFLSNGRLVGGTNCQYAIKSNGAQNIFISNVEASLANADLILTGDATHLAASVFINGSTFNKISLDYAQFVYGGGNSASQFISTENTADVCLNVSLGTSQTIAGTRVTIFGESAGGKFQIASNNNVRFEVGSNPVESSGAFQSGTNPSTSGSFNSANNAPAVSARNSANSGDVEIARVNAADRVVIAPNGSVDIVWGSSPVSLGGGAAPTLGTIGGSGPGTAAQYEWLKLYDTGGQAIFIPVWR